MYMPQIPWLESETVVIGHVGAGTEPQTSGSTLITVPSLQPGNSNILYRVALVIDSYF